MVYGLDIEWPLAKNVVDTLGAGDAFFAISSIYSMCDNNSKNIGELICKGNNVMMGYATNYNDLNNKISLETLNTGDLAYKDKDGFYFIEGRIKRIIKT